MAAGITIAVPRAASSSTSNPVTPSDPRASVLEIEWRTPTGYERCAAVVTARRPQALEAVTAGHCAQQPFSVIRLFDGHVLFGSAARVLSVADAVDAAAISVTLAPALARATPVSVPTRIVPAIGSILQIIGHPVAALAGPNAGRWTVTFGRMGEVARSDLGSLEYEVYCSRCGPGDSGSGVFNGEGRLVGIVYGVTEIMNVPGGLPDGLYADVIPVAALP
jgi:Trypsin-like peptidase domain